MSLPLFNELQKGKRVSPCYSERLFNLHNPAVSTPLSCNNHSTINSLVKGLTVCSFMSQSAIEKIETKKNDLRLCQYKNIKRSGTEITLFIFLQDIVQIF